jgi:hypothetical protein
MSGEEPEKLSFDSNDFKFNVAYQSYEKAFAEASPEDREMLNETITKLFRNEITYPQFYDALSDEEGRRYRFHRSQISTTRKFAYRRAQRKANNIKRHR